METQVIFHGQSIWVRGVADVAVILSDLVKVLVIGQAASMSVGLPTLIAGKRPPSTFCRVKFLRPGGSS